LVVILGTKLNVQGESIAVNSFNEVLQRDVDRKAISFGVELKGELAVVVEFVGLADYWEPTSVGSGHLTAFKMFDQGVDGRFWHFHFFFAKVDLELRGNIC